MTYEEIAEKYPINKVLFRKIEKIKTVFFWYSEKDKEIYRAKYSDAVFSDDGTVKYTETRIIEKRVEGWLYDGSDWYVVENSWDGWITIDQEDLDEFKKIGIAYEI